MSFTRSKAVIELGTRLVSLLGAEDDLLASWMAHHVAQLIDAAEKGSEQERMAASETCASFILELWRHRAILATHHRPGTELEPILRTLASLDPEQNPHRYYPNVLREVERAGTVAGAESKEWLDLAIGLDFAARLLIRSFLQAAAERAASATAPWVELAAQAGADGDIESAALEFLAEDEQDTDADKRDAARKDRIRKLEAFIELATAMAGRMRARLGADGTPNESSEGRPPRPSDSDVAD